jgi:hypothetical protein
MTRPLHRVVVQFDMLSGMVAEPNSWSCTTIVLLILGISRCMPASSVQPPAAPIETPSAMGIVPGNDGRMFAVVRFVIYQCVTCQQGPNLHHYIFEIDDPFAIAPRHAHAIGGDLFPFLPHEPPLYGTDYFIVELGGYSIDNSRHSLFLPHAIEILRAIPAGDLAQARRMLPAVAVRGIAGPIQEWTIGLREAGYG